MQRIVEIYKNERYQPTSGFSSNGLLMSDRNKFSTMDGRSSWNTISEAEDAMLSFGWEYINSNEMCEVDAPNWEVDLNLENSDENGWSYCTSFSSFDNSPSGTKGMMHFVRRQRLVRKQRFYCSELLKTMRSDSDTGRLCNNCDLEEVDRVSSLLMQALGAASIVCHGVKSMCTEAQCNALKTYMMKHVLTPLPIEYSENLQAIEGRKKIGAEVEEKAEVPGVQAVVKTEVEKTKVTEDKAEAEVEGETEVTEDKAEAEVEGETEVTEDKAEAEVEGETEVTEDKAEAEVEEETEVLNAECDCTETKNHNDPIDGKSPATIPVVLPHNLISISQLIDMRLQEYSQNPLEIQENLDNRNKRRPSVTSWLSEKSTSDSNSVCTTRNTKHIIKEASAVERSNSFSAAFSSLFSRSCESGASQDMDHIVIRMNELNESYFSRAERSELAKLIICKLDIFGQMHCCTVVENVPGEEHLCRFQEIECANEGCNVVFSRLWLDKHDARCGYKVIDCERACGDDVCRMQMAMHLAQVCRFRPASCPYAELGCIPLALRACDVEKHVEECTQGHLMLATRRIIEQQNVIIQLNHSLKEHQKIVEQTDMKLNELEKVLNKQSSQFAEVNTALAAGVVLATQRYSEQRHAENRLDHKIDDNHSAIRSEVSSLKTWIQGAFMLKNAN